MSEPYIGEIRMFGGNFAPAGWALCEGQLLAISENDALFTLIGTTYGGDGEMTFGLPDLRGRLPMHQGNNHVMGEQGGVEEVTLTMSQLPTHTHAPGATNSTGDSSTPASRIWAAVTSGPTYTNVTPNVPMNASICTVIGGNQPHTNMQPYL